MSFDGLITASLIYLSIGAVLWLVLDGLGIIDNTFVKHSRSQFVAIEMVLATLAMIFAWPVFVFNWLKGMWGRA